MDVAVVDIDNADVIMKAFAKYRIGECAFFFVAPANGEHKQLSPDRRCSELLYRSMRRTESSLE